MKTFRIFSMAALAIILAACSSNDEITEQPAQPTGEVIHFSGTISTESAATRTQMTENGDGTISVDWKVNDVINLCQGDTKYGTAQVKSLSGTSAYIEGTLTSGFDIANDFDLIYLGNLEGTGLSDLSAIYANQKGIVSNLGEYDCRKGSAKLKLDGSGYVIDGTAKLEAQMAIWKLTLTDGTNPLNMNQTANQLKVYYNGVKVAGSGTNFTGGSTNMVYLAVPPTDGSQNVKIEYTDGTNTYSYQKAGITIAASKYYQSPVTLTQILYTDLSAIESANTYLVTAAGNYKFNATVKGNGGLDPITGVTATPITGIAGVKVLWELGTVQGRAIKYEGSAYDISYDDGYVYFSTPETFTQGNCYVAIYNSSNEILWSWLIWAGAEPSEVTSGTDKFMNRNLGSIAVGNYSRGFLYQWGRKDPFPAADGSYYTPYSYVPARLTSHSIVAAPITVAYAIANPTHFTTHSAWMTTDDYRADLWSDTEKTIYDPCPAGWRVPTRTQMNNFKANVGLGTLPGTGFIGTCSAGGDFAYGNPGTGYYRSSTVINRDNSYSFCNDGRSDQSWPNYEGFAVRPVRDIPAATSKSVASLTNNEIGWRLGNDGVVYSPTGALPAGVTAEAIIAYVGAVTNYCDNFIAIALADAGGTPNWADALTAVGTYAAAHPININGTNYNSNSTGSDCYDLVYSSPTEHASNSATTLLKGWRLPSVTDWRYIIQGLCNGISATDPIGVNQEAWAGSQGQTYRAAIAAACGIAMYNSDGSWWTSSVRATDSNQAWLINFYQSKFYSISKTSSGFVRAVFAY